MECRHELLSDSCCVGCIGIIETRLEQVTPGELLSGLLALAERCGIELRLVNLQGEGEGFCRLRGQAVLFVDTSTTPEQQAETVARCLVEQVDLEARYIRPELRRFLEGIPREQ